MEQKVAQAMADEYGHGQAWKCMAAAKVAVRVMRGEAAQVPVMGEAVAYAPAPVILASRCPMCFYQHGHQIGCENNPVDIALLAAAPKKEPRHD